MADLLPVDLRSDTVTRPTPEMRRAMGECEVGDDRRGSDPTVERLQTIAAEALGKDAAVFVPSGTMGNAVATLVHTVGRAGRAIVVGRNNHMVVWESEGLEIMGVERLPVATTRFGEYDLDEAARVVSDYEGSHGESPGVLCLEDTHNGCGGTVPSLEFLRAAREFARERGMKLHLDGARIFNAATYLGVEAKEIAQYADSVMFCISKGLASPAGSLVCGEADFVAEARAMRNRIGGGMRQAGVLAACGIVSVTEMTKRLGEDHANCRLLAEALAAVPGIELDLETVQTNIVYFKSAGGLEATQSIEKRLNEAGVLCAEAGGRVRMVTHNDVSRAQVEKAIEAARRVLAA
ncbi:MAG: GntG family PLP-dependent aldolase [Planctomycetota bacterium]|jgi:threonine aldolase